MRTASTAFKQLLASGGNTFLNSVSIQLASNETLSIDNTKLMNLEFEDCVGSDNTFDALGSTIINSCKITIYNGDESFSEYDFEDAVATVYVGLQVGSSIESRQIGVFTVDNATNTPNAIILSMLDNMSKFDEPYSKSSLVYPATLAQIIADACTVCGVTYNSNESDSDLDSLSIDTKPDGESTTFRDVIGWVATIKCTFARCNSLGQLELKWFDKTTADSSLPRITSLASQEIATSDIAVTGVKITIGSADTDADTLIIVGTDDYLISITNNPFITTSNLDTVKTTLSTKLIGLTFRKCNIVCLNNPLLEAGDAVRLTDTKGNFHRIIITRTTFSPIINQTVVCGADTPSKNSATLVSKSTRVEATLKSVARTLRNKITSVETIANNINQYFWFTSSGTDTGAHITEVPQEEFTDPNSENYHAGYNTLFKSIGLAIRNGLTELATFSADTIRLGVTTALHIVISGATIQFKNALDEVLASFGSILTLGKTDGTQSYLRADYHSLQMIDRNGKTYFYISDLRDADNYTTLHFTGDGTTTEFNLTVYILNIQSVKINGSATTAYTKSSNYVITFNTAPSNGSDIEVTVQTNAIDLKAYTLGTRKSNSIIGKMSFVSGYENIASSYHSHAEGFNTTASNQNAHAEGLNTTASGLCAHSEGSNTIAQGPESHAEGMETVASGVNSHSEGSNTTASGGYSHAEGGYTTAGGEYSHTQNRNTIASGNCQTACGKYNIEDTDDKYAVIVGNGDFSSRSNAFAINWDGDIEIALDLGADYLTTDDGKLAVLLDDLNWLSSVIV